MKRSSILAVFSLLLLSGIPAMAQEYPGVVGDKKDEAATEALAVSREDEDATPLPLMPLFKNQGQDMGTPDNILLRGYKPPAEPTIAQAKFFKIEPPRTIGDRVNAILFGIYTDVPPQFDHFGYEMRRYMAHVAGPQVLSDPKRLKEELVNIEKAKIILKYWRATLIKEVKDVEKTLDEDANAARSTKTAYKYNHGVIDAFFVECQAWLDNNTSVLQFLLDKQGLYTYQDSVFTFQEPADRITFVSLYKARERARLHINEYAPFANMVY